MASKFRISSYSSLLYSGWNLVPGESESPYLAKIVSDEYESFKESGYSLLQIQDRDEVKALDPKNLPDPRDLVMVVTNRRNKSFNDLHRFVGKLWFRDEPERFAQNVLRFLTEYGSLWSLDEPQLLGDYYNEFRLLGEYALAAEGGNPDLLSRPAKATDAPPKYENDARSIINIKLAENCTPMLLDVSRGKTPRFEQFMEPKNLAGYLWQLVAKDAIEGITYTACDECQAREVPSRTPFGKPSKYCTNSCQMKASRKRLAEGKASLGIQAKGTATIKKGGKNVKS